MTQTKQNVTPLVPEPALSETEGVRSAPLRRGLALNRQSAVENPSESSSESSLESSPESLVESLFRSSFESSLQSSFHCLTHCSLGSFSRCFAHRSAQTSGRPLLQASS